MILEGAEPFLLPGGPHGVLLVHGFTGLPAELLLLGQYLNERGFTVLGVRLAGHATTPENMSHMTGEDWLDSVRDGYALLSSLVEDVSLVGHSMGGLLSLLLATEKEVQGVVTLAAPAFVADEQGFTALPPREKCVGVFYPKARRHLTDVPRAAQRTYRMMPLVAVHEFKGVMERTRAVLGQVRAPLLIVQGKKDHTAAPRSADYIYEQAASERKEIFWLEESGHLLPLLPERELVFERTARFLGSLTDN